METKYKFIIGAVVIMILLMIVAGIWMSFGLNGLIHSTQQGQTPLIQSNQTTVPVTTVTVLPSSDSSIPETKVIQTPGQPTMVQYGDETPEEPEPTYEAFQPYASILANDVFRSDPSFDYPHSKIDYAPSQNF